MMLSMAPLVVLSRESGSGAPSIVAKSPFLPPGFQPPGTGGSPAASTGPAPQFEFRGVYKLDGVYFFNLYNTRERRGSWVKKGAGISGFPRIVEYDEVEDLLARVDDGAEARHARTPPV